MASQEEARRPAPSGREAEGRDAVRRRIGDLDLVLRHVGFLSKSDGQTGTGTGRAEGGAASVTREEKYHFQPASSPGRSGRPQRRPISLCFRVWIGARSSLSHSIP